MDAGGKRCNCEKSKCLKLYCSCFAAGVYCADRCGCRDCFNNPSYEGVVEDVRNKIELRNHLAFALQSDGNLNNTSSAGQKEGCRCKTSKCLLKSCGCLQAEVGCSVKCRCGDCHNSFGEKPGKESGKKATNPVKIEDCKCNCKGTKCWKLSCKCVAVGTSCKDCCTCEDCHNKPKAHPIAEPPTDSPDTTSEGTSASTSPAKHKRKCSCKKTKRLMDKCNCYQAEAGCSNVCRCKDCHNLYGKKSEPMLQTAKNWKNQSNEMPNMGEVMSDSTKAGTANQSSPTWEKLTDINNLTASTRPCSIAAPSFTSHNIKDCENVSVAESDSGTNSLQYSSALCTKQMCPSKDPQEIHSVEDLWEMMRHDLDLTDIMNSISSMMDDHPDLRDVINSLIEDSDLTDKMKSGSPNQDQ